MASFGFAFTSISSRVGDGLAALLTEAPDAAGVEVAVDVHAVQFRKFLAAIHVPAGDAFAVVLAVGGGSVRIFGDRRR